MDTEKGSASHGLQLGKKPEDIHVLLVDDERLSRVVVGNLLRKCNYQGAFSQVQRVCESGILVGCKAQSCSRIKAHESYSKLVLVHVSIT